MTALTAPFTVPYPPVRELFIPDTHYTLCASDLDRADTQVVAWDSGCERLKNLLKENLDVHLYNAGQMYGLDISLDRLRDPKEVDKLLSIYKLQRQAAKNGGHATNYLVQAKTLASTLGITITEAQHFIDTYFKLYPEILDWHKRIWNELLVTQTITNAFGFRIVFFDRINHDTHKNAVAWIPQSTVALVINKAWEKLDILSNEINTSTEPGSRDIEILLQVHDELIYEVKTYRLEELKPAIKRAFEVTIPYDDPLIIPSGLKTSLKSWGEMKTDSWEE